MVMSRVSLGQHLYFDTASYALILTDEGNQRGLLTNQ